ncbi:unnamed protein product [Linum trigynum]|uniref:CCHC-type domain-containing protein n=1 Tax=Linum trigynum TaxID=586398 RepID=A0AAV2FWS8_9ROSI
MIVWVQLPALKVHFYHREILTSLGNLIGRTIKLDYHTINRQRRKFARLAVEIDMSKPLVPRIFLDDQWQKVVYENLPTACFECGKVGHKSDDCPLLRPAIPSVQLFGAGEQNPASPVTVGKEDQPGFGPWMLVSKKSRRKSRDTAKKGKAELFMENGSQGQAYKNEKGGAKIKEGDVLPSASVIAMNQPSQRTQGQERKGGNNKMGRDSSSTTGKGAPKGKEIMRAEKEMSKGLLGPGPVKGPGNFGSNGKASSSDASKASSSAQGPTSPKAVSSQTDPLATPQDDGPVAVNEAGPNTKPPAHLVVGSNGTKMQIISFPSSPKRNRQSESKSPSAAERTRNKKYSRRQAKKSSPVKLQASKALQVWSPVKDRKVKAKARMASLTLQEINAWTGAMDKAEAELKLSDTRVAPTEESAPVDGPAFAPASTV